MDSKLFFKKLDISEKIRMDNYKKYSSSLDSEEKLFFDAIFKQFEPAKYFRYIVENRCSKAGLSTEFISSYLNKLSPKTLLNGTKFTSPIRALNIDYYNNDFKQMFDFYIRLVCGDYISYTSVDIGPYYINKTVNHKEGTDLQLNLTQVIQNNDRIEDIKVLDGGNQICYSAFNVPTDSRKLVFYKYNNTLNKYEHYYDLETEAMPHGFDFNADNTKLYIGGRNPNKVVVHQLEDDKFTSQPTVLYQNSNNDWISCATIRKSDGQTAISTYSKIIFFDKDGNQLYHISYSKDKHFFDNIFFFGDKLGVTHQSRVIGSFYILSPDSEGQYSFDNKIAIQSKIHGAHQFNYNNQDITVVSQDNGPEIYFYDDNNNLLAETSFDIPEIISEQGIKAVAYNKYKNHFIIGCRFTGMQVFEFSI